MPIKAQVKTIRSGHDKQILTVTVPQQARNRTEVLEEVSNLDNDVTCIGSACV